jgi:membrane protein required for colicin V production
LNLLDYILIVVFGYCLIRGFFRGLVGELSAIIGVIGGFYGAYTYYPMVAMHLKRWIGHPVYLKVVSFLLLFMGICLIIALAAAVIKYFMRVSLLQWADRTGGAVFGALKSLIIALILILMLTTFLPSNTAVLRKSLFARHLMQFSAVLVDLTTKEMQSVFSAKMKELNLTWKHRNL